MIICINDMKTKIKLVMISKATFMLLRGEICFAFRTFDLIINLWLTFLWTYFDFVYEVLSNQNSKYEMINKSIINTIYYSVALFY